MFTPLDESSLTRTNLGEADWYWGSISRDETREKLFDACDGTFLVRDASGSNGEFSLTVKKDGTDRVIRIYCINGRYSFIKDPEYAKYSSVVDLIRSHRTKSLKEYNSILDVKLLYPVSRFAQDEEFNFFKNHKDLLVRRFFEVTDEIKNLLQNLGEISEEYKNVENEIEFKRQAINAYQEAEEMFKQQLKIQEKFRTEAHQHELVPLKDNNILLKHRFSALTECKENLEKELEKQSRGYQNLEMDINKLKLEMVGMMRQERKLKQMMMILNMSVPIGETLTERSSNKLINQEDLYTKSNWYFESFSRIDAECELQHSPVGTFLIRRSSIQSDFALSIKAEIVCHCMINKTHYGTYGFAEPYNNFKSLEELVLYYSINSLKDFNKKLQTTLKIPFRIYRHSRECL